MTKLPFVSSLRKVSAALLVAVMVAAPAWAGKYASIVVDLDSSRVLHAREADEPRYPASLTKVMTLYMVFDELDAGTLKLSERMPVSKYAAGQQPSKLGLKKGGTIKVEDAIRALVTKSANDVAVVFAERLGGTESKFAAKMTAKAKALGLTDTTFKNASGLPNAQQQTTARDMAKLAEAMYMDHRDRYNYFSVSQFTWNKRKYINHNTLLKTVRGVDGIKTGYTNASGYNLMASAERDGRRVIAVMLGGTTGRSRDEHVRDLLEAAFVEIGVGAGSDPDLGAKVAFGDFREPTADDLAAAQLKRFADLDAKIAADEAQQVLADATAPESTEEAGFEEDVAQGDAEQAGAEETAEAAVDAIGALIGSSADEIGGLIEGVSGPAEVAPAEPVDAAALQPASLEQADPAVTAVSAEDAVLRSTLDPAFLSAGAFVNAASGLTLGN